tara:strand:- start:44 stop:589 length:546 start_codon:yes stop_codon:yes gene_type:complete
MAEAFSNKLARAVGVVSTSSAGTIGITSTIITGVSTAGLTAGDLVDNQHYIAGTKILNFGTSASEVVCDRNSTNTASASGQSVKFLTPNNVYQSPSGVKSILIGGTFANNTNNQVNLTVSVYDNSSTIESAIAQKIPVPAGSSFVISDAGKTLLESQDVVKVYCDTANAIDVNLSILTGVS